ncbi:methyltransferase domain-containing protein [Streptomyces sp. NPDC058286]
MYGEQPSSAAAYAADVFRARGAKEVLELGAGHGRAALYFARERFTVQASDFSATGLGQLKEAARAQGVAGRVTIVAHDVRELHDVAAEIGRYAAAVTDELPWAGTSFMDTLKTTDLASRDVRAEKTYRQAFDPALPEASKAALTGLTCALNVVDVLLADDANGPSAPPSRSCATSRCTTSCRACASLPPNTDPDSSPQRAPCWTRSSPPRRATGSPRHTRNSATPSSTTGPSGVLRSNCA